MLRRVAETETSNASVVAGGILLRLGGPDRGLGVAALMRALQSGEDSSRLLAIAMVPVSEPEVRNAVQRLAEQGEPRVKVAAVAKLATWHETKQDATNALGALAVSQAEAAKPARLAMARLGDRRVTRLLLDQAKSRDKQDREHAMNALVVLGDYQRAAFFLADPDANVRMGTACRLLTNPR